MSDGQLSYEKEACSLLTTNVKLFTSMGKNLPKQNFPRSRHVVTQIWRKRKKKFGVGLEILRKWNWNQNPITPTCVLTWMWFDGGGCHLLVRVQRIWYSSSDYVPIRCEEKVPHCVVSFFKSFAPMILVWDFLLLDVLDSQSLKKLRRLLPPQSKLFWPRNLSSSPKSIIVGHCQ